MDHEESVRLYGPWRARTPDDAAELLRGYPGTWWIAGGWAIEAFTGVAREHDDLDPSIPHADAHLLWRHLHAELDLWMAEDGALRPMLDPQMEVPATCGNLWLRAGGAEPWEYDVILTDVLDGRWRFSRDPRITRPLDDVLWERGGLRYLRPEVQLAYKAKARRPKDEADFAVCLPLLDASARDWLAATIAAVHPGHPWIDALTATG